MNDHWAKLIIDHFVEQGVHHFCLSPGSRSTPLAWAVSQDERIESTVHFDERGAAFHAYGIAKASHNPVVVISTSGSALGNIFPAVMEASHDFVPLIILTADRPPELQECGANQACDQTKIFGSYVRWQSELPCPDPSIADAYIGSTIAQAVYRSKRPPQGPVHLNWKIREPLLTGSAIPSTEISTHYETSHMAVSTQTLEQWAKKLSCAEKGIILAGPMATQKSRKAICQLAQHLHWPIFPDILSGLRSEPDDVTLIPYFDALVKLFPELRPDCILHLGERPISKAVSLWLEKSPPQTYMAVADHPLRHDPSHLVTHRMELDPVLFCQQILPLLPRGASWLDQWQILSLQIEIDSLVSPLSEPSLTRFLHHHLPPHFGLFLANSMPIRDADQFFFPRFFRGPIFGKRGLSGIDGNIATALGIAKGAQKPIVAVLGDQTALHDINSLALAADAKYPVVFVIINNGGGGIFHFLPISQKESMFEKFMAGAHTWNFSGAAKMFRLPYIPLTDFSVLGKALHDEKSCIVELSTNRIENADLHQSILRELKKCAPLPSCTVS